MNRGLLILSIILLAGCSNGVQQKKTPTHTVIISEMKFEPATLQVAINDSVVFINQDFVPHDVTESISKKWSSGALAPGTSWTLVVKESAAYHCTIHPVMKGELKVK